MSRKPPPDMSNEEWAAEIARREAALAVEVGPDPAKTFTDTLDQFSRAIALTIDRSAADSARVLQLKGESHEFRRELADGIVLCLTLHRMNPPPKRYSDIRKELVRASKEAAAVVKSLRRLYLALDDLTPMYKEHLGDLWEPRGQLALAALPKEVARFDKLSALAARLGEMLVRSARLWHCSRICAGVELLASHSQTSLWICDRANGGHHGSAIRHLSAGLHR
jgi:hypothetical protein